MSPIEVILFLMNQHSMYARASLRVCVCVRARARAQVFWIKSCVQQSRTSPYINLQPPEIKYLVKNLTRGCTVYSNNTQAYFFLTRLFTVFL
jgi:hypothetical protein